MSFKDNIMGNENVPFVATGNATAEIVGKILIPLCIWLGVHWLLENPAPGFSGRFFLCRE